MEDFIVFITYKKQKSHVHSVLLIAAPQKVDTERWKTDGK